MKKLLFMVIFLPMSLFSAPVEFWTCKFADGYDMNDLNKWVVKWNKNLDDNLCLLYTSPSPRDRSLSRMPSSA